MSNRLSNVIKPYRGARPPDWPFALNCGSNQARGLIAWYPMGLRGGSTVYDMSGRNKNLAATNGPTWTDGLRFAAGSSQYAEINEGLLTSVPVTLVSWLKVYSDVAGEAVCLVSSNDNANWFSILLGSAEAFLQCNGSAFAQIQAGTVVHGRWHLVCGVFAATNSRTLYLDGVQVGATETTNSTQSGINRFAIGGLRRNPPDNYFTGYIGDTRIYNRALSDAEVYALFDPATRYDLYWELGRRVTFSGGQLFTQSFSGSIAPAGALTKQDQKTLAGTLASAGAFAKQTQKEISGALGSIGGFARQCQKAISGALAQAGSLIKQDQKSLSGSITPTGALQTFRVVLLALAGAIIPSGALAKLAQRSLSGAIAPAGGFTKLVGKLFAGILTLAGSLINFKPGSASTKVTVTLGDKVVTRCDITDELGG